MAYNYTMRSLSKRLRYLKGKLLQPTQHCNLPPEYLKKVGTLLAHLTSFRNMSAARLNSPSLTQQHPAQPSLVAGVYILE